MNMDYRPCDLLTRHTITLYVLLWIASLWAGVMLDLFGVRVTSFLPLFLLFLVMAFCGWVSVESMKRIPHGYLSDYPTKHRLTEEAKGVEMIFYESVLFGAAVLLFCHIEGMNVIIIAGGILFALLCFYFIRMIRYAVMMHEYVLTEVLMTARGNGSLK